MSETDPALEPVPVTKDTTVVNGNGDIDLPPPDPELTNGVNKPVMDLSNSVNDSEVNGDHIASGVDHVPVNGDLNGDMEGVSNEQDLLGADDLPPPPPAVAPELPPPPPMSDNVDLMMCDNDGLESSVDPVLDPNVDAVGDTNVDNIGESNVDQLGEPIVDQAPEPIVDEIPESSVDPIPETSVDSVPDSTVDPVLESSVDPDVVDDQCVDENDELMNVSDTEEVKEGESSNVLLPEVAKVVEDVSEEELVSDGGLQDEVEIQTQNQVNEDEEQIGEVQDEGTSVDTGFSEAPVEEPTAPTPAPPETPAVMEPEVQPEPVQDVVEPEVEVDKEEAVSEPVLEAPHSEPEPPTNVEVVESEQPPVSVAESEPVQQQQVGYAEPDIIVDNKPAEEVETPPPPPPPLVDETPPPPPPSLDESIPLRRVSGGSSPSKESNLSLETPSPMNVAVVPPQPEQTKVQEEPSAVEPTMPAQPVAPVKAEAQEPQSVPPTQPIAVVAPQVHTEPGVSPQTSPPASPPGSPSSASVEGDAQPVTSPQVSQKINKKNFKNKIKFGVDLVEASLKQLNFLRTVNNNSGLYEEWLFKKAIRRYEAFWLPLAAEHKKECLAAPLDIEWVWHCHMLAPVAYESDCKKIAGLLVDHKVMNEKDRTKTLEKSKKYWTAKYPKEPFEIELVYREKALEEPAEVKAEETQQATADDSAKATEEAETKETEQKGRKICVTFNCSLKVNRRVGKYLSHLTVV